MKTFLCLKCKKINKIDLKNIGINNPKVVQCNKCFSNIHIEFISRSCCRMKYKFALLDSNNEVVKVKYNSFPKR